MFSASMTPASAASVLAAIEIMENEPERIKNLWDLTRYARNRFNELGFDTGKSESPIIPLFIRDDIKALQMAKTVTRRGGFHLTRLFHRPVPREECIIRILINGPHILFDQVDKAIEKITLVSKELEVFADEVAPK